MNGPRLLIYEQLADEWLWPAPYPRSGRHHWRAQPWPYAATEEIPHDAGHAAAKHREVP